MSLDGRNQFALAFQVSPIIFANGIAGELPGSLMPIISITEAQGYDTGLLGNSGPTAALDSYFASFRPLSGSTLAQNTIGLYPFANQSVAANAIIAEPLQIALLMTCPARGDGGFAARAATMGNLQSQVARHGQLGGTYTVCTPSFIYTDCILTALRDMSGDGDQQAQAAYVWEFVQPLLTLEAAREAQNSLMTKLSNGTYLAGDPPSPSGQQPAVGQPASGQAPSTIPAAQGLKGASAGGAPSGTLGR